jgi:F-type H+-transporting ATPase subunit alpha
MKPALDQYLNKITSRLEKRGLFEERQVGLAKEIKDGVVIASGLVDVEYGELVVFENGALGQVIEINENEIGIIVFGNYQETKSNQIIRRTNQEAKIGVSKNLIGRVIDPLGNPLDGMEKVIARDYYPYEKIAPGVIYRQAVNQPLQTGIKAIDALIPIGRGQRELIIGDRGTGKTTIAIDTIINQKGKDLICVYCAIGQKASKVALLVDTLTRYEAMEHTIVVAANAADPVSLQYMAPYAACAIGEYFMDQGKDVLVVYDDLSKHAWAYRQISLILRRPAGREAYPGDIFYLHSRLLERACRIDKKYGGGSLTALPIIETLEGDVSAYIPTNVISITDGQIFLENDLFNKGIRPAINVGISVSRVGSSAQTNAVKKVAKKLKLQLAQYREMAAFAQFESELDEETKKFIQRGARITSLLVQGAHQLYSVAEETVLIWTANQGYFDLFPIDKIGFYESKYLSFLKSQYSPLLEKIEEKKDFDESLEKEMNQAAEKFLAVEQQMQDESSSNSNKN